MSDDTPFRQRAKAIVSQLTLQEKALQMQHNAPAVERLGVPAYNWWNECLHGVARAGTATVFPQAIGLAATWNAEQLKHVASVIATEARAKHHEYLRQGDHGQYKGLTYWTPNINIFRDPRWGRGHETYGECPHLTARLGVAFCEGLQGDDPTYFKVIATPKHFAVHSGPEEQRHSFNAEASPKDLRETYLPAFHACITEAKAYSIMGAYNRTNGEPCCASQTLLQTVLREEWAFDGFVVSDCWAIKDFHENHKITKTKEESAALAVKIGCDLNCGCTYEHLPAAVEQGLLTEAEMDICLERLFTARMRLGEFDPPEQVPYSSTPYEINDCLEHRALSRKVAQDSMVLLKNEGGLLPLRKDLKNIAVIGPNADDHQVLLANYFGMPSESLTPLNGIKEAVSKATRVWYTQGCKHTGLVTDGVGRSGNISEAVSMAKRADVTVLCMGLSADIEGEQGDVGNAQAGGDKQDINLTGLQQQVMEAVAAVGKPVVLVVLAGSPVNLRWAQEHLAAIVYAWYPGGEGGRALADVLFGDVSPAGRLPITFPMHGEDVPAFENYSMRGRTYRYSTKTPLYPFGYGLSYSRFEYSSLRVSKTDARVGETIAVSAQVTNVGDRQADEVVQLYVHHDDAPWEAPLWDLRGFTRLSLAPGASQTVSFTLDSKALSLFNNAGDRLFVPGTVRLALGGSQPDPRSAELLGRSPQNTALTLVGESVTLPY